MILKIFVCDKCGSKSHPPVKYYRIDVDPQQIDVNGSEYRENQRSWTWYFCESCITEIKRDEQVIKGHGA